MLFIASKVVFSMKKFSFTFAFFITLASATVKGLPYGFYLSKCLHCHISDHYLQCECHDATGKRIVTRIDPSRCEGVGIEYNRDTGKLECVQWEYNTLPTAIMEILKATIISATMAIPTDIFSRSFCIETKTALMAYFGVFLFFLSKRLKGKKLLGTSKVLHDIKHARGDIIQAYQETNSSVSNLN
jgi:hypothetical protein